MDLQLVDIDKVLDDLESLEHNSSGVVVDLGSVPQPPSTNRRIKVRSVLSSLNDYVDYDSKSNEMQEPVVCAENDLEQQRSTQSHPSCEPSAGLNVNKSNEPFVVAEDCAFSSNQICDAGRTKASSTVALEPEDQTTDNISAGDTAAPMSTIPFPIAPIELNASSPITHDVPHVMTAPNGSTNATDANDSEGAKINEQVDQNRIEEFRPTPDADVDVREDDMDLESYLDKLVEEYDKSMDAVEEFKQPTKQIPVTSRQPQQVIETKINGSTAIQVEQKELVKVEEVKSECTDPKNGSPAVDGETAKAEMETEELREYEDMILQQEREKQMEMDRQMALKLQADDDGNQVLSGSDDTTQTSPSTTASASGVSPLEAPRSTSVRATILEETPEYRYLMNLGKVAPYWVPDTTHDSCMQCDQKFSLLKRRHHCRCCGELLCASCCSLRAPLEYMRDKQQPLGTNTSSIPSSSASGMSTDEARICTKCDKLVQRRDELLQLRYLAECGIGEDSGLDDFPIKGVLKKPKAVGAAVEEEDEDTTTDNSDSQATPTKAVIFSDGVRPGHVDDIGDSREVHVGKRRSAKSKPGATAEEREVSAAQSPSESEVVAQALNSYKAFVTALKTFYNVHSQSYLPPLKSQLPPLLKNCGSFLPIIELRKDFNSCLELCEFLKEKRRDYLIQKRLHCAVQIVDYRIDANQLDNQYRWCLNVTTNGMSLLGQKEFVILVEINADYFAKNASSVDDKRNLRFLLLLLRRLFVHFNKIYSRIRSELQAELRAKQKVESQAPDPTFLLLDNHVVVAPFQYFNRAYVPALGGVVDESVDPDTNSSNGNESDESETNYICDKYTFLNAKSKFVQHMDLQKVTFGKKEDPDFYLDFSAILYVQASLQSTQNVIMPDKGAGQALFGLFVKHTEIPWAKLFALRLLLRLGAEYHLYPWPLFNALDRKSLYSESVDNSIIYFLSDFRGFSYTLNDIPGLHMHMEHDRVISSVPDATKGDHVRVMVYLPKINYKRIEAMIKDSSESILSFAGGLNQKADGHLVCIQQDVSKSPAYSTQSLNIERGEGGRSEEEGPSKTGLNFFILNGALKSITGLKAKMSIIEDGVMVQVLPNIMTKVRTALLEMRDVEVRCEETDEKVGASVERKEGVASEVIYFVWTDGSVLETKTSSKSEIDEQSLESCSYVNLICDYFNRAEHVKSSGHSTRLFGLRRGTARLELDCFYLHLHRVVLLDENYFALFNEKLIPVQSQNTHGEDASDADMTDKNANLIKSLNVSNWEVPSINFLLKLAALLGHYVDKALSKHYSKLYNERLQRIGVRFHFDRDQIVTYEAGSSGTKLPMVFMNDLDSQLIPMLHHILELDKKDAPSLMQYNPKKVVGSGLNSLGHNLNAEFLDRINLLQNLQRSISFELEFEIVVDLP